jgi:alpha-tubulin suppressor-like RCC1 family protein
VGGPYATVTAADGGYTVPGLTPAGDYQVCFFASFAFGGSSDGPGYIDQCWQTQAPGTPTPVSVTTVATRTGINAALAPAGAISGTVTDAGGNHDGLAHVAVQVTALPAGAPVQVATAVDGSYSVPRLPAGAAYQVCFLGSGGTGGSSDPTGYIDQCWPDQATSGTATPVILTPGSTRTGISAALVGQGGVTNVAATQASTSIVLSWTNPGGTALTGVTIRRAAGGTAPASVTYGDPVAEVAKPATTYTDNGLASGTQYSYALFAHDGTPLYATSATITTSTLITVSMVSTGSSHSCAVTTSGGVKCWGYNGSGELGNGNSNITSSSVPVDVAGLGTGSPVGAVSVSAGQSHSCAVTTAVGVKCWGFNGNGELGDGTTAPLRNAPVDVVGLGPGSSVIAVSAGASHTCALTSAGAVECWGYNFSGQLGDGSNTDSPAPVLVTGLGPVSAISAGDYHSCALTTTGAVKCWGANGSGQLGHGTITDSWTPVDVTGLSAGAQAVSAGSSYSCAVTAAGGAQCWGSNGNGQLGDGTNNDAHSPVDVAGLATGVSAVSAGSGPHTCAVVSGGAMCWGYNASGQLGDATHNDSTFPVAVSGLGSGVGAVSAGGSHACDLTTLGAVQCWGMDFSGQLGDGTFTDSSVPVAVYGLR